MQIDIQLATSTSAVKVVLARVPSAVDELRSAPKDECIGIDKDTKLSNTAIAVAEASKF